MKKVLLWVCLLSLSAMVGCGESSGGSSAPPATVADAAGVDASGYTGSSDATYNPPMESSSDQAYPAGYDPSGNSNSGAYAGDAESSGQTYPPGYDPLGGGGYSESSSAGQTYPEGYNPSSSDTLNESTSSDQVYPPGYDPSGNTNSGAYAGDAESSGQTYPEGSNPAGASDAPGYGRTQEGYYGEGAGNPANARVDPEVEANRKKIEELFQSRTWSNSTGEFKFEGKFVAYSGGKVTLQRKDSENTVTLEMKQLSDADQKFIRDGLKAQVEERNREEIRKKNELRRPRNNG